MIEIKLTEQQIQNLITLIDNGVRATGLQSVFLAAEMLRIFNKAIDDSKKETING